MADPDPNPPSSASTRQRRVLDAANLLPVLAIVLMLVPILWAMGRATSSALVYVFTVWMALIGLSGILSRSLARIARIAERSREGRQEERKT
ncbi:MAG: hypothetical protein F4213_05895 [Boseongicola sp. SB0677_bin_26]|nr:hypothetical protein [Boseongicola sp. SB0665_bin_10]MYG25540.1 hypothetical protein [Boseongicola sp. SB0677_bin_26]